MSSTRFNRLADPSTHTEVMTTNDDVYQQDRLNGVAIDDAKVDGDFNRIIDFLNELDADISAVIAGALPVQTGNANKTLISDGTNASWQFVTETNISTTASRILATDSSGDGTLLTPDSSLTMTGSALSVADGGVTTAKIANSSVTTGKITNANVTLAKLAGGTADRLLGFDGSGDPSEITASGLLSISSGVASVDVASQVEAEAGTDNATAMTPLRTKQVIDANLVFTQSYESSTGGSLADSATVTFAHGLGVEPKLVLFYAECTTAADDYSVGDKMLISMQGGAISATHYGMGVTIDATNIIAYISTNGMQGIRKSARTFFKLDAPNWELHVKAYA